MNDFNPDCVLIPLSKTGKYAGKFTVIVSPEDADLALLNWSVKIRPHTYYAQRRLEEGVLVMMHRIILKRMLDRQLAPHEEVDHINRNGLDNRRENLRIATRQQNMVNRIQKNSIHRGVHFHKKANKYVAKISVNGKPIHLGLYNTVEEAKIAYQEAALKYFGELWLPD